MPKKESSFFFTGPAIGIVFGDLSGNKGKENSGSGLISPLGIDIGLLLGWTFGIGRTFGLKVTPGIVLGKMGFIVIAIGLHWKQKIGLGIVFPIWPIW